MDKLFLEDIKTVNKNGRIYKFDRDVNITYNMQTHKLLLNKIRSILGDIYTPDNTPGRTYSKMKLFRKGRGQYQFELKINNDGTISINDNSDAFFRFYKDKKTGDRKCFIRNGEHYFTSKNTYSNAVDEIIGWLIDNYDRYEPVHKSYQREIQQKKKDNPIKYTASGKPKFNTTIKSKQSNSNNSEMTFLQKAGINDLSDYLANGGKISDLLGSDYNKSV